jgi:hypothetical protein
VKGGFAGGAGKRMAGTVGTGAEIVGTVVLMAGEVDGWSAVEGVRSWCGTLSASSTVVVEGAVAELIASRGTAGVRIPCSKQQHSRQPKTSWSCYGLQRRIQVKSFIQSTVRSGRRGSGFVGFLSTRWLTLVDVGLKTREWREYKSALCVEQETKRCRCEADVNVTGNGAGR